MSVERRHRHGPEGQPEQNRRDSCSSRGFLAPRLAGARGLLLLGLVLLTGQAHAGESLWLSYKAEANTAAEQGRYNEAEKFYRAAIKEAEKFGSIDPRLADSLNGLAILYATQHKYPRAEPLLQRALGVSVAALGPDHPDVAVLLTNIGILKAALRNYAEAEVLLGRSLSLANRVVGQDHPVVAVTMRALAVCQAVQGRYGDAECFIRRSLEISEKTLGSEHPDVATSLEVFAQVLRTTHRDGEARDVEIRAQEIRTSSAGLIEK